MLLLNSSFKGHKGMDFPATDLAMQFAWIGKRLGSTGKQEPLSNYVAKVPGKISQCNYKECGRTL
jgi:hypothetical protein